MPPKPPNKRLSLVERQQKLLEADGFSKTSLPTPSSSYLSLATDFRARQDAHLLRRGMANAASVSRVAVDFSQDADVDDHDNLLEELEFKQTEDDKDNEDDDSKKSVAARSTNTSTSSRYSRYSRHAPSIHPSLSGLSEASTSSSSSCSIVRYSTITGRRVLSCLSRQTSRCLCISLINYLAASAFPLLII